MGCITLQRMGGATAYSCALTRGPGVITMSLTATTDGTDNSSTTRRIEIVARDNGKTTAHRAHHQSISKVTWTRCLEESFNGGNEIWVYAYDSRAQRRSFKSVRSKDCHAENISGNLHDLIAL